MVWYKFLAITSFLLYITLPYVATCCSKNNIKERKFTIEEFGYLISDTCEDISNFISGKSRLAKVVYPFRYLKTEEFHSMSTFEEKVLKNKHYFNPIDLQWQEEKCNELNLNYEKPDYNQEPKPLKKLTHPVNYRGHTRSDYEYNDKKQTYNLLSELLCRTKTNSETIKERIQKEISSNPKIKTFMNDKVSEYQHNREKNVINRDIGTQVEIFAAALAFDICIYVYGTGLHRNYKCYWTLYHPKWPEVENLDMKNEKCLYVAQSVHRSYINDFCMKDVY